MLITETQPTTTPQASQTDTTETTKLTGTAEAKPVAEPVSPELTRLAEKERAIRAQARQIQAEKARIKADQEAMKLERAEYEKLKSWKDRTLKDPYGGLLDQGLTSDQVAALMLNQPAPVDQNITLLQQKMQAMEAAQEKDRLAAEERSKQQYQQAKKQVLQDVKVLVDGNDAYENIREDNAQDLVVDTIEEYYKEHGELMTAKEAADHIEEILLEDALKRAQRKKIQEKLSQLSTATTQTPATPTAGQKPAPTLTNRMSQSSTPKKHLSWAERKERAILAAQGKLTG